MCGVDAVRYQTFTPHPRPLPQGERSKGQPRPLGLTVILPVYLFVAALQIRAAAVVAPEQRRAPVPVRRLWRDVLQPQVLVRQLRLPPPLPRAR
jgi:hypothetical protein